MTSYFPTPEHAHAADTITAFFDGQPETEAVVLVNSCARGKATRDSCLDVAVLAPSGAVPALTERWERFHGTEEVFRRLGAAGAFAEVHLDVLDGEFKVEPHDINHGADFLEVEVGNLLVYGIPLREQTDRLHRLRERWLPYYSDDLRSERLAAFRDSCRFHLDHIPRYIERELYFQSFDRLYTAFGLFLQALFIARRAYPISYNKWIREQVEEILGLPDLYRRLPPLFEIERFESREMIGKANALRELLEEYAPG